LLIFFQNGKTQKKTTISCIFQEIKYFFLKKKIFYLLKYARNDVFESFFCVLPFWKKISKPEVSLPRTIFFYVDISFLNLFVKENFKNTSNSKIKVRMGQTLKKPLHDRGYLGPLDSVYSNIPENFPACGGPEIH
jgi:hypothetical protein